MKIIVCVDNNGGMLFNGRRQSRDRNLISDIISITNGSILYGSEFSAPLFAEYCADFRVCENFLENAGSDDYCFVENKAISGYINKIDELIIYRWNRDYPADMYLDIDPLQQGYVLDSKIEFAGYSHETITREVYKR